MENPKHEREHALDIMKFLAVILVFWAHTIAFIYSGINFWVLLSQNWANVTSFSVFLVISGALVYIVQLSQPVAEFKKSKYWRRVLAILLTYYLVAFAVSITDLVFLPPQRLLTGILETLAFVNVPGYSEFWLPFVAYSAVVLLMPRVFRKITTHPWLGLVVGLSLFALGEILFRRVTGLSSPVSHWAALFFGGADLYRFPLLQYSLVFIFGLQLGRILKDHRISLVEQKLQVFLVMLGLGVVTILIFAAGPTEVLRRWPPSLGFLAVGIAWCTLQIMVLVVGKLEKHLPDSVLNAAKYFSENMLALVAVHTVIISVYGQLGLPKVSGPAILLLFLGTTILTLILQKIPVQIRKAVDQLKVRKSLALLIVLVSFATIAIATSSLISINRSYNQLPIQQAPVQQAKQAPWFDSFSRVALIWKLNADCCKNTVEISFDHKAYVTGKYSREDGKDLRLVLTTGAENKQLNFSVKQLNTNTAIVATDFTDLPISNEPRQLKLFMGDLLNETGQYEAVYPDKVRSKLDVKAEEAFPLVKLPFMRLWNLATDRLEVAFSLPEYISEADNLNWVIIPEKNKQNNADAKNIQAQGEVLWSPGGESKFNLDFKALRSQVQAGKYYLGLRYELTDVAKAALADRGLSEEDLRAYMPLIISEPVYMTWTIDWEGYDLAEKYMRDLENLSSKNKMPLTQYFNPRIYVNPAVTKARATQLTKWAIERAKLGDEIGLHLHMHLDLVAATGLTPKTEPRWGGRLEGHDVLTTAYNEQEYSQILKWSLQQFKTHGLPVPQGFRSGAWFLDIDNLRALDKAGFAYDTSGSDFKQPYGPNKQSRTWDLTPTSQPYQVSRNDQNSSKSPLLNIWELPNNGADSTNRTAEELLRRLHLNVPSQRNPATRMQILTYLSHPHWFNIDKPKMEKLFAEASKYKYEDDNGPLIYTTSIDALKRYQAGL